MPDMTAERALQELLDGNRRYVAARLAHPHQTVERRQSLAGHQSPFAIILGCSDSRVPPEVIFDQGLGDLFVVRVAGNVLDAAVTASLEYAADHLETPLLVVLGHTGCGAVHATLQALAAEESGAGSPGFLANAIRPAVAAARVRGGDLMDGTVRANVEQVAGQLAGMEPVLSARVRAGQLRVAGMLYDLHSGRVELLEGDNRPG